LLLLAAVCGEHLLLLGPPGTAKSELVSMLSYPSRNASPLTTEHRVVG
jgi:MoxR-like ATPase